MSSTSAPKTPSKEDLAYAKRPVFAAKLDESSFYHEKKTCFVIKQQKYTVPLKHDPAHPDTITVTARVVLGMKGERADNWKEMDVTLEPLDDNSFEMVPDKPIAVYLVGGPGSDNPFTANPEVTDHYLNLGFQVLFMDYRGTGSSTLQRADQLDTNAFPNNAMAYPEGVVPSLQGLTAEKQAETLTWYRQDNIVRDLEAIRKHLVSAGIKAANKWTLVGQSYGGWVSFTYLSFYPEALNMVIVTGGIPPVGQEADDVYRNTYKTVITACDKFYQEYPHHVDNVKRIVKHIQNHPTPIGMPGGGKLTPERFLCVGRTLGTTNGDMKVDSAIMACIRDLGEDETQPDRELTRDTLIKIESWLRFEERPLYAILQEPIYTEHPLRASDWSAEKIGNDYDQYWWLKDGALKRAFSPKNKADEDFASENLNGKQIYLSAEHVYHFHYDQFQALQPLKKAAEILAKKDNWPPLFDVKQLKNNKVPTSSLSYERDMFIDANMSRETLTKMGENSNIIAEFRGDLMHTALKDKSDIVLPLLWENLCKLADVSAADVKSMTAKPLIKALEAKAQK
ncbi:hypothetical protein Sste5346_003112 [Sporothrix stenoceras]|uniref:AB hydrolase-1 domain-containing protein n=1 Tax=Sporothrix stenoceras TaxID=5173 RepID=A0ABR3ZGK4_9PEZI